MSTESETVLALLAECPDGATDYALATLHGISAETLDAMLQAGQITCHVHTLRTGIKLNRYHLNQRRVK